MKVLLSGTYNDDLDFEYGDDTSVLEGCGATLMGQFWYFGGRPLNNRQVISKVTSNKKILVYCMYLILGQQDCWMPAGASK